MMGWSQHGTGRQKRRSRAAGEALPCERSLSLEERALRLRLRLQEMGPEQSCFALYLSSRVDLLPAEYCRELALTPDLAPPLPPEEVRRLLERELGSQPERAFAEFDYTPEQSSLIAQRHRGRLLTGARVTVNLLRPCFSALRESGADSLNTLCPESQEPWDDLLTLDIFADFETSLRCKTDFIHVREGLELMARDAASFEPLRTHRSYPELCTQNVLTLEAEDEGSSQTLDEIIARGRRSMDTLATRICYVWLQQALRGHCFPVDPHWRNIRVTAGERIIFHNCDLVSLPGNTMENLLNYLDALLAEDPDKSIFYLLREMTPAQAGGRVDIDSMRSNFRQAAYFGLLEPVLGTNSNAIAQIAFQHCRTAREHRCIPKAGLICFYRGLFSIARAARQVCPEGDQLREGLKELRATIAFDQMREIMDWRYWYQNTDKFASAMVNMPRAFDEALTRISTAGLDKPLRSSASRRRSSSEILVFLLVLAAVISQLPVAPGWSGKMLPLTLMLAGLLALRVLRR
jgi:ubiquinone biosynthesis protein